MPPKKYTAEELKKLSTEELQQIRNDLSNKKLQKGGRTKPKPTPKPKRPLI